MFEINIFNFNLKISMMLHLLICESRWQMDRRMGNIDSREGVWPKWLNPTLLPFNFQSFFCHRLVTGPVCYDYCFPMVSLVSHTPHTWCTSWQTHDRECKQLHQVDWSILVKTKHQWHKYKTHQRDGRRRCKDEKENKQNVSCNQICQSHWTISWTTII